MLLLTEGDERTGPLSPNYRIRINKSTRHGVIIAALEVIESSLFMKAVAKSAQNDSQEQLTVTQRGQENLVP